MKRKRDATFGGRLRLLREDAELTQDQLIERMAAHGVTIGRSYISELERTAKMPNGEVVIGLARVLRTTADYLLGLTENPDPPRRPHGRFCFANWCHQNANWCLTVTL
jgi:transcriptional regulator with XRE-family HTH domain